LVYLHIFNSFLVDFSQLSQTLGEHKRVKSLVHPVDIFLGGSN